MHAATPADRFLQALDDEQPLQIAGTINAYCAILAEQVGFRAIYLSGAGVANASHGLPDLGITSLNDVLEDARRITSVTETPLLVDCDTGWGSPLTIERTVRDMTQSGVAAIHLEDQVDSKRCGHRAGKQLVSADLMVQRVSAAVGARSSNSPLIMARTDAAAVEGLSAAIERANRYVEAGADLIFAEAMKNLDEFRLCAAQISAPVLANITEFGQTPMLTSQELGSAGIQMVLYPLTAFRAMNYAARLALETIKKSGSQTSIIDRLQTREELYETLNYQALEQRVSQFES